MTLLTFAEAATRLRVSKRTVERLVELRKIAFVTVTEDCRRITESEIDRFIRDNTEPVRGLASLPGGRTR